MATNLNLDDELAEIKALPSTSTQWTGKVAALLRKIFHSNDNPWGPNVRRDALPDGSGLPVGAVMAFGANRTSSNNPNPPPGFILCDGRSVSRTRYAALFKVCGTRFGTANPGSFNVPDLRRRQIIGRSTDFPVGTRSGAETKILSINELPTHRHGHSSMTVSERPDHGHSLSYVYGKDEFPDLDGGSVAIIAPSPSMHQVPDGTQGWTRISGNPDDFNAGRSGAPSSQYSGSDGAHGHRMRFAVTNAYGGGEEFSLIGPSIVLDFLIYSGIV